MAVKFLVLISIAVESLGLLAAAQVCPNHLDIAPCQCTRDTVNNHLDMDCSLVVDLPQLQHIFHADFPCTIYHRFSMVGTADHPVELTYLPEGVFGSVSFEEIDIHYSKLQRLSDYVFSTSNSTLRKISMTLNELVSFPTTTLQFLPQLELLDLSHNNLAFIPDLHSSSLHTLNLAHNPSLTFSPQVFDMLTNVGEINMESCGLESLMSNVFLNKINLTDVYLGDNLLTTLIADSLALTGGSMDEIILSGNKISSVKKDFASGLGRNAYLVLLNNQLATLPEEVWRPVFQELSQGQGTVILDGNPLECGCDLGWLVTSPDLLHTLALGADCLNATAIHDLNPGYYETNCA